MTFRILCDFDGTVTTSDVTDMLLEAFALPEWQRVEAQWQAGQIGSAECMARQVSLLRCGHEALDTLLDTVRIDPGFAGFAARCRRAGISLAIVSDGLDYAIHRILARLGITGLPVFANALIFLGERRYALQSPYASVACQSAAGTCKCRAAVTMHETGRTVLIGDGRSDFCSAETADLVFAKDALLAHCRSRRIAHVPFTNFNEIAAMLFGDLGSSLFTRTPREYQPVSP